MRIGPESDQSTRQPHAIGLGAVEDVLDNRAVVSLSVSGLLSS